MFGCETFNIRPDAMVMSKQITSSYVPFSAIMLNEKFYAPLAEESGKIGVLGHGFTAGGHPVGAAVALENLAIIEERELVEKVRENSAYFLPKLHGFADHPVVGEVRGVGMIAAIELVRDKETKKAGEKPGQMGLLANETLAQNGMIIRNIMDVIALCPPMIINRPELDHMLSAIEKTLDEVEKAFLG